MVTGTYQLNLSLGQAECVNRLQTYKTERCVTLVHDRSAVNNGPITDDDLMSIFEALGNLPNLQKLRVDFCGRPLRLPAPALTIILRQATILKQLVLEEVRLAGSVEELETVSDALRCHPSLQIVDLHGCYPADVTQTTLDPIISALAHVQTLTEVLLRNTRIASNRRVNNNNNNANAAFNNGLLPQNLMNLNGGGGGGNGGGGGAGALAAGLGAAVAVGAGGLHGNGGDGDEPEEDTSINRNWDGDSLTALCQSTSLRVLTLRDMAEVRDHHLEVMADSLRTNDTLRELTVCSSNLGERSGRAMGQVLQVNRHLQKLEIQLNSGECAIPITEVLQGNCSLKRLDLYFNGCISPRIREAFTEMLRRNYVLLDLNGSVWRGQSNSEIDFYLRLNRAGRADLLTEHASRARWVDTMISQKDDLSIVFSLLVMNPSICMPAESGEFKDVSPPGGVNGSSLHLRKRKKGLEQQQRG